MRTFSPFSWVNHLGQFLLLLCWLFCGFAYIVVYPQRVSENRQPASHHRQQPPSKKYKKMYILFSIQFNNFPASSFVAFRFSRERRIQRRTVSRWIYVHGPSWTLNHRLWTLWILLLSPGSLADCLWLIPLTAGPLLGTPSFWSTLNPTPFRSHMSARSKTACETASRG